MYIFFNDVDVYHCSTHYLLIWLFPGYTLAVVMHNAILQVSDLRAVVFKFG